METARRGFFLCCFAVCGGICAAASRALGVITYGTGNNFDFSAAPESTLLTYEGNFGAFTGTAIGSQYLLTATHTNPGTTSTFTYNNTPYNIQVVASIDDVSVWQATNGTFANYVPLYTGSSEKGGSVVDLGRGLTRGSSVTGGWAWGGYESNSNPFSWGTNSIAGVVNASSVNLPANFGDDFLQFNFNTTSANEAIDATGDSGGGLFIDVGGGNYQLAGVNSLVSQVQDASGNFLPYALYDAYGYYQTNSSGLVQIMQHGPLGSDASRISTKVSFINAVTGVYSSGQDAASPVMSSGAISIYQSCTTGAITGGALLQIGYASSYTTLQIAPGSGGSTVSSLALDVNSSLDLTSNHIFIDYGKTDPRASVISSLAIGYNGGSWNGHGIGSSTAGSNAGYALGYADSADGIDANLSTNQIEIAYALYGDITLQGNVNGSDFAILASHFGKSVTGGWAVGDFNYDGVVNATDFALLAANFGKSASGQAIALPASEWAALDAFAGANGLTAQLPEPGALTLAFCLAGWLGRRSRKPGLTCPDRTNAV